MWEIFENLPSWAKLTGISIPTLIIILFFISFLAGPEVVKTPKIINEEKHNVTEQIVNSTSIVAEESSIIIINEFHNTGEQLAKNVDKPEIKNEIIRNWTIAGILIALVVVFSLFSALFEALKP